MRHIKRHTMAQGRLCTLVLMHTYNMTWLSSMMKLSSILQHSRFMEMAVNLVYDYPYATMIILSVLDEKNLMRIEWRSSREN